MSDKTNSISKNKDSSRFIRIVLLIALVVYIVFRVMDALKLFNEEIDCTAEQTVTKENKEYLTATRGYLMDNANGRTNEKAFEGKYSVKLSPENPYGMQITFGIPKVNDEYEASVWVYKSVTPDDTSGFANLVVSVGKDFWQGSTEITEKKNGWGKLKIKFNLPLASYKDSITFYCWNSGKSSIYFDNLVIKRKNYWKYL